MTIDGLRIKTLGGLSIERDGKTVTDFASRKAEALLMYLACNPRAHPREVLAELLWDDRTQRQAMANLRVVLASLRREVGDYVDITRTTASIASGSALLLDVAELEAATGRLREQGGTLNQEQAERLAFAIAHYQGDFLEGFHMPEASGFEAWALRERMRLQRLVVEALLALGRWHLLHGDAASAITHATRLLEIDPLTEAGHRLLMEGLARAGRRLEAMAQFEHYRDLLSGELGAEPEAETRALYKAIKVETLVVAEPAGAAAMSNLPAEPTPFLGRDRELAALERFIADTTVPLVTIVGPGGIGKTRLALEVAHHHSASFADGVAFVSLAPLSTPEAIVPTLAQAVGLSIEPGDRREPKEQLLAYLRWKKLLLVLDNFEHLAGAESLLTELARAAPAVKLLVTSRERLKLQVEQVYPLQGLALAQWETVEAAETDPLMELFLYHAKRVRPSFSLRHEHLAPLQQIFWSVGGTPLAVILAAGWVEVLSPREIAAEIGKSLDFLEAEYHDLPARQRSMRAVFGSTWQRLSDRERAVSAALSVFRGGFTTEAATAVARAVPQDLRRLLERSLIAAGTGGRFQLHELLRQFAAEQLALDRSSLVAAQDRHVHYFLALVEKCDEAYRRTADPTWLDPLAVEHDNIRAALGWALGQEEAEIAGRISGAMGMFWGIRGYLKEGGQWLEAVLARRSIISDFTLANVFFALGWLAFERGDYVAAEAYYTSSYDLVQELGATALIAEVLSCLGHVAQQQGNYDRASALSEESLSLYRQRNDTNGIAMILNRLGRLAELNGDYPRAIELMTESLQLRRANGDERGLASSLNALAEIARYQGDYARAALFYEESLAICTKLLDKRCVAGLRHNLAHVALHLANCASARALFQASLTTYNELENMEGVALCLAGLGAVFGVEGELARAAHLLGKADSLLKTNQIVLEGADGSAYDHNLRYVRTRMEDVEFDLAWTRGQNLTLDKAIQYALL